MSQQVMNPLPSETHLFLKMLEIIFFFLKKILPSLAATKAIWPTVQCHSFYCFFLLKSSLKTLMSLILLFFMELLPNLYTGTTSLLFLLETF